MKRVLDFIKALGAFQGKRYDHSYIGRVSIAFGARRMLPARFPATVSGRKKRGMPARGSNEQGRNPCGSFGSLDFLFSQYRSCNTQTGSFSNGDSVEDLFP